MERFELIIGEVLDSGKFVFRTLHREDQFGQFQLNRHCIPILGVLNQEYHQKGDDRSAGIDNQLPCVAVAEQRSCRGPDDDHGDSKQECYRMSCPCGDRMREPGKLRHQMRRMIFQSIISIVLPFIIHSERPGYQ